MVTREDAKMCVGEGWHHMIDEFYDKFPNVHVVQVKEKYGSLRIYHDNGTDESFDLEMDIIARSMELCEECGSKINVQIIDSGWIYSLCNSCYEKRHNAD